MKRFALLLTTVAACTGPALAQSFNADISSDGQSAPADSFGASARQPGFWNNILNADDPGEMTLKRLDGSNSSVKVKFPGIGISARNNEFSGDFGKLVNDFHYTNDINQGLFYEVSGLEKGVYVVYIYSNRPNDNGGSTSRVAANSAAQYVTGTIEQGKFEKGVTHACVLAEISTNEKLTISAMVDNDFGVVSGFQIVKVPSSSRIYIKSGINPSGDGSSWDEAYGNLFAAMKSAKFMGTVDEIWVAGTVHFPTPDNTNDGDRDDSFELSDGLQVIGGFAGNETSLEQRVVGAHETALDGQLGDQNGYTGNTYHIVRADGVNRSAVLDGFTVLAGFADGSGDDSNGPGMLVTNASPTIRNCSFLSSQCKGSGGAVYVSGVSEIALINCTFYNNYCLSYGGAIRFALETNGWYVPKIWNCRFIRNGCEQSGGALNVTDNPVWIFNSAFIGNFADNRGGAIRFWGEDCDSYAGNCTFYGNDAAANGGIESASGADVEVRNSILWGNSDDDAGTTLEQAQLNVYMANSTVTPRYNLIRGWTGDLGGEENFDGSPSWMNIFGQDGNFGTLDDDVRLKANSPCIDRGRSDIVFKDWLDLDGDGLTADEFTPFDLYGGPRDVNHPGKADYIDGETTVDVGAAEFNPIARGDMNCDGSVDFNDIDPFVLAVTGQDGYQAEYPDCNWLNGDVNLDGTVDFDDIDPFVTCITNGGCE